MMAADDELSMLSAMSDSFWKQKRARMKADLAAQLLELDEFEAREKALQQVAAISGGGTSAGALGAAPAELMAMLEAEKAKTAALEAELAKARLDAELNMQKVSAFWISKLDGAKSGVLPLPSSARTRPTGHEPRAPALMARRRQARRRSGRCSTR